jgi:hypothetical protein
MSRDGAGVELDVLSVDGEHVQEARADNVVQGGSRGGCGGEIEGGEDGGGVLRRRAIDVESNVVGIPSMARDKKIGDKDGDHDDDHGDDHDGNAAHPTRTRAPLPSVDEGQSLGENMVKLEVEMGGSPASRREIESWIWIVGFPPFPL